MSKPGINIKKIYSEFLMYEEKEKTTFHNSQVKVGGFVESLFKKYNLSRNKLNAAIDKLVDEKVLVKNGDTLINNVRALVKENGNKEVAVYSVVLGNEKCRFEVSRERQETANDANGITPLAGVQKENLVGTVEKIGKNYYFKPLDKKISKKELLIANSNDVQSAEGFLVGVSGFRSKNGELNPVVFFERTLGVSNDPLAENNAICFKYGAKEFFPADVDAQAELIADSVSEEEIDALKNKYQMKSHKFMDMRDKPFCTVDPETCKDMDDAVYVEKLEDGTFVQYTAIAMPSYYIAKGSPMDKEAQERGNSIYCGNRVAPMVPFKLSNGICSLNEGVDRLVMITKAHIDKNGNVLNSTTAPGVIHSRHKLSYEQAQMIHDGIDGLDLQFADVKETLDNAFEANIALSQEGYVRGRMDFENHEATFRWSADGKDVTQVLEDNNTESHKMIESNMLVTNVEIAKFCGEHNIPIPYRVHEEPALEDFEEIFPVLAKLGIPYEDLFNMDSDGECDFDRTTIQSMLQYIHENLPDIEEFANELIIAKMPRATYSTVNAGHFALAYEEYTQTTSPIRRYCDQIIQTQLLAYFAGEKLPYTEEEISKICDHLSMAERNAKDASMESNDLCCAVYAEHFLGETIRGFIRSVSADEIVVKANGIKITMPLSGEVIQKKGEIFPLSVKDKKTGKIFTIGKKTDVKIDEVDRNAHKVYDKTLAKENSILFGEGDKVFENLFNKSVDRGGKQ